MTLVKTFSLIVPCVFLLGSCKVEKKEKLVFEENFDAPEGMILPEGWKLLTHQTGQGVLDRKVWCDGKGLGCFSVDNQANADGMMSQTEIATIQTFEPKDKVLDFKIRCRIEAEDQRGLVFGFFLYNQYEFNKAMRSDEIDIEILTNLTAGTKEDKFFITSWNEWNRDQRKHNVNNDPVHGNHVDAVVPITKNTGEWQTYTIRWSKGLVEWFVEEENGSQTKLGGFYGHQVPYRPMNLHIDAWVAPKTWDLAYDPSIVKATSEADRKRFNMIVDWVRVYESDVVAK